MDMLPGTCGGGGGNLYGHGTKQQHTAYDSKEGAVVFGLLFSFFLSFIDTLAFFL